MTKAAPAELVPCSLPALAAVRPEWNRLAALHRGLFMTQEWVSSWWQAFGDGRLLATLQRAADGSLRGAACCRLAPNGALTSPTDSAHSYEWDVLAVDDASRRDVWDAIARFRARRAVLALLPDRRDAADAACEGLRRGGYRVVRRRAEVSPYLPLPANWDDLLGSVSRNLRQQWRHKRRALDRDGGLVLRTTRGGDGLDRDLDRFLELEASGWKGRAGTAIACEPRAEALYRGFARLAAREGWLRLSFLEAGGTPIAAVYDCAFAGRAFHMKSAFDERYADRSPGLVLMGEALRRSIEEGLEEYDFLGSAEHHKLRWGALTRARVTVRGYRGAASLPAYVYRARLRPLAGRARQRLSMLR